MKKDWKHWLNEWESYLGTVLFVILLVLLFGQVVTRYVLKLSFSWLEEAATIVYVGMVYCAIASATTHRKHIVVDALTGALPFKAKKVVMILNNLIFFVFCVWLVYIYAHDVMPLLKGGTTAMLGIPKTFTYGIIPVFMSLTAIRVIQNIYRLSKETEQTLGASVPTIDVDKLEQEYLDQVAAEKKEEEGSK